MVFVACLALVSGMVDILVVPGVRVCPPTGVFAVWREEGSRHHQSELGWTAWGQLQFTLNFRLQPLTCTHTQYPWLC